MDIYYKREASVGFLVIIAVIVMLGSLSWLKGRDFSTSLPNTVSVQLDDVSGLKVGDPVYVSGVPVGRVTRVSLVAPGQVMVDLAVSRNSAPHADATVRISTLDFFGAQKVDYFPGESATMLEPGRTLVGTREIPVMNNASALADQAAEVMTGLQRVLSEETTSSMQQTMAAAQAALEMVAGLDRSPLMRSATATMEAMQELAVRLDSVASNPALDSSVSRLDEVTAGLAEMTDGFIEISTALNSILVKIDSGQGSIGSMVNDTTLVHDMHEVMTSLQLLLDDVRERPQRYVNVRASIF